MGDRSRGVVLYAATGVVLLTGAVWFVRAAPDTGVDPRVAAWRATAEGLLPDEPRQAVADTMVLTGVTTRERTAPVDSGAYTLIMVCAGTGRVRVRLSAVSSDSGRAVRCADDPVREQLDDLGLPGEFFMLVTSEPADTGSVVFRWRLDRALGP
ncbi:DUF6023 family protein [Jidongwangia harbinensis]|uniref:DUF6023 family protein n=1 Tax=Jidongwangia harbinensis TaxID=2878561 RepID=UPI001CD93FCF|nr:DUF6023 family protein [Jidongwangia harbinensis]MCA2213585.1 DUF6023 family protein [Jidongwangia harbinensis]